MEDFLHFVWQNRLYQKLIPKRSLSEKEIEVLDTGVLNTDAGADFFNAKIRIDNIIWVGAVEIHHTSAQWYEHKHDEDPSYENVILHIVENDNQIVKQKNGAELPCCEMLIADELRQDIKKFFASKAPLPCSKALESPPNSLDFSKLMLRFKGERHKQKLEQVKSLWKASGEDWARTLYFLMMRYFGLGINNDVMEFLARSLDLRILLRHKPIEQEALLLGQAGLITCLSNKEESLKLQQTYDYLSHKYELKPLPPALFKRLRTRPQNFPDARIKQFVALLNTLSFGADSFEACHSLNELLCLLRYGKPQLSKEKRKTQKALISKQVAESLIINAIAPYITFSRVILKRKSEKVGGNDFVLWQQLPAERNKITRLFSKYNFPLQTASDSQAVLYLYREYCMKKKCFFCPFGRKSLTQKVYFTTE